MDLFEFEPKDREDPRRTGCFFTIRPRLCVYVYGEEHYNAAVEIASIRALREERRRGENQGPRQY